MRVIRQPITIISPEVARELVIGTAASLLAAAITGAFQISVATGLLAAALTALFFRVGPRIPFDRVPGMRASVLRYKAALRANMNAMPFIYRDELDITVLDAFVDVDVERLSLAQLETQYSYMPTAITLEDRLRDKRHVILLGNAGMGKTTLQRFVVLTLLRGSSRFVHPKERIIPLYIPLKAIDNSRPRPILRYILEGNSLFQSHGGVARFRSLAASRRLFLFLDGYDEIAFGVGGRNYVREELEALLFDDRNTGSVTTQWGHIYAAARGCRIWLASRFEFFQQNPIGEIGAGGLVPRTDLFALRLSGVGENRKRLAQNIFAKYAEHNPRTRDLLNAELFVGQIDESQDDELRRLSFNPLFLTIMCYVYARMVIDTNAHQISWAHTIDNLIDKCVALLIVDLDAEKARDLPDAHRQALLGRRNAFPEVKHAFLRYFASELYSDERALFSLATLKAYVTQFCKSGLAGDAGRAILDGLSLDVSSRPNFALQLIYCGVFVVVDWRGREATYDFAHRRFREVLGSEYVLERPERYVGLLRQLPRIGLEEFLRVFSRFPEYQDRAYQDRALELLLEGAQREASENAFVIATQEFVRRVPEGYDGSSVARQFVMRIPDGDGLLSRVSREVLKYVKDDRECTTTAVDTLRSGLRDGQAEAVALACEVVRGVAPDVARTVLPEVLASHGPDGIIGNVLMYNVLLAGGMRDIIRYTEHDQRKRDGLYAIVAVAVLPLRDSEVLREMFAALGVDEQLRLLAVVVRLMPGEYGNFRKACGIDVEAKVFEQATVADVLVFEQIERQRRADEAADGPEQRYFVISHGVRRTIEGQICGEHLVFAKVRQRRSSGRGDLYAETTYSSATTEIPKLRAEIMEQVGKIEGRIVGEGEMTECTAAVRRAIQAVAESRDRQYISEEDMIEKVPEGDIWEVPQFCDVVVGRIRTLAMAKPGELCAVSRAVRGLVCDAPKIYQFFA